MKEQRIIAHRRLSQLEMEKARIEHAIDEIQRRFTLLDEVESWGLLVPEEPSPDYSLGDIWRGNYENQDNYQDSREVARLVPAGYSSRRTPSWARLPLVA